MSVISIAWLPRSRRPWAIPAIAALVPFIVLASLAQRELWRVDRHWELASARAVDAGAQRLLAQVESSVAVLEEAARRALEAPPEPEAAFAALEGLLRGEAESGVVLYRAGIPTAWAGTIRMHADSVPAGTGVSFTSFYVTLHVVAERNGATATAATLLQAIAPADRLARGLDRVIADETGVRGFEIVPPGGMRGTAIVPLVTGGDTLALVRALPASQAETRLHLVERARVRGAILLVVSIVLLLVAVWRHARPLPLRVAALAVALSCVAIVPLNEFSNATRLFDPAYYFAPLGGPFTASIGALGITSALVLLGLLGVLRSRARIRSRAIAFFAVLVIAGLGPFLLRDLARGITPPAWGVDVSLWLGWQVTLFLAAVSILLAGASAGRVALGARRGLSPVMAPALAVLAALLGPIVWEAPARWPGWYPALWILAIGALALGRAGRRAIPSAAIVAGLGAATLVWGATVRQRVALAERDVAGLTEVDPTATMLLERFASDLADLPTARSRGELLRRYVASDLAPADYPVQLTSWSAQDSLLTELRMAELSPVDSAVKRLVGEALGVAEPVMETVPGVSGHRLVLAIRHDDGGATAVAVEPRTRLIPDDPFTLLLGVAPDPVGEPPYVLTLTGVDASTDEVRPATRWSREDSELHSDWQLQTPMGERRVHVEVELRTLDALVQRGGLILLLNLALLAALWVLSALADGGYGRWLRRRRRQWVRSYRARLSLALTGFFIVPAILFAAWSYRRLQSDDRQSRELLVREALRAADPAGEPGRPSPLSEAVDMPLLLYRAGRLEAASDPLYDSIAPAGRFLPPPVHLSLTLGDEVTASSVVPIGSTDALFGYRRVVTPHQAPAVLAAPAPANEVALDRRRRDLGVLVLFATAVGVIAAISLSGLAARELARPIAALRGAALAIAEGEREPPLALEPPVEFVPVFSAFRRMASDLAESRTALEEAQRRTAAILRNVASGVVAVDAEARVALANPRADALLDVALPPGTPLAAVRAPELERRVREFLAGLDDEEEFDVELGGRQMHARLTRLARGRGVVLTLDDVTELARAQRVLAWGEMARQVAHEIKNPLTPIRLGVQHLRRAFGDRRADFDRILEQNVTRILQEIDRLDEIARAFSRYGTAPADRAPTEPTDVAAIVRDVVALETLGEDTVDWRTTGTDAPAVAHARSDELREVLLNVLENARLAGAGTVDVSVVRANGAVRVRIRDDGEGIPPDVLPRIFEPHFSTRTSGSGLGLAISRRIVDGWGGAIEVESERGAGTTVELSLRAVE